MAHNRVQRVALQRGQCLWVLYPFFNIVACPMSGGANFTSSHRILTVLITSDPCCFVHVNWHLILVRFQSQFTHTPLPTCFRYMHAQTAFCASKSDATPLWYSNSGHRIILAYIFGRFKSTNESAGLSTKIEALSLMMICICLHKWDSGITAYIWNYERIYLCTQ